MSARTPESLTRLERAWLKRRLCAWCDAPTQVNVCYAITGEFAPIPEAKKCTEAELNERRGRWLAEHYRPRPAIADQSPKGGDAKRLHAEHASGGPEGHRP